MDDNKRQNQDRVNCNKFRPACWLLAVGYWLLKYARFVTFSHSVFALPFALLGAFLAGASRVAASVSAPSAGRFGVELVLVVAAMVAARSAAMAFNRIVDARFDAANPRTAARPLAAGRITLRQAWGFFAACVALFFAVSASFLALGNPWPIALAGPVLGVLCGYSLSKRFTAWCHVWLGVSLGLSPVAAWVAISPHTFGALPLTLGLAVTCWVAGFDILYALQDAVVDRRLGLRSVPAAVGTAWALRISRSLHAAALAALLTTGLLARPWLGGVYAMGLAVAACTLFIEHRLVRPHDFSRVNNAFFTCNGFMSLLLGGAGIVEVMLTTS